MIFVACLTMKRKFGCIDMMNVYKIYYQEYVPGGMGGLDCKTTYVETVRGTQESVDEYLSYKNRKCPNAYRSLYPEGYYAELQATTTRNELEILHTTFK